MLIGFTSHTHNHTSIHPLRHTPTNTPGYIDIHQHPYLQSYTHAKFLSYKLLYILTSKKVFIEFCLIEKLTRIYKNVSIIIFALLFALFQMKGLNYKTKTQSCAHWLAACALHSVYSTHRRWGICILPVNFLWCTCCVQPELINYSFSARNTSNKYTHTLTLTRVQWDTVQHLNSCWIKWANLSKDGSMYTT